MADLLHGQLMYNNTRLVISSTERQYAIIDEVHEGLRHDPKDKTMDLHCGSDSAIPKISNRFFDFFFFKGSVKEFIKKCNQKNGKF